RPSRASPARTGTGQGQQGAVEIDCRLVSLGTDEVDLDRCTTVVLDDRSEIVLVVAVDNVVRLEADLTDGSRVHTITHAKLRHVSRRDGPHRPRAALLVAPQ